MYSQIPVGLLKNHNINPLSKKSYQAGQEISIILLSPFLSFECLNLRINDFDLEGCMLTIHDGKGKKDRTAPLPETVIPEIRKQFEVVVDLHENDLNSGHASDFLKGRLNKKYKTVARELVWQFPL